MRLIICSLPPNTERDEVADGLFPGSFEAMLIGCTCPAGQPEFPPAVVFNLDCPVHELQNADPVH